MDNLESRNNSEPKVDFSKIVELPSGVRVINCTPHVVIFIHDGRGIYAEPSGAKLSTNPVERVVVKKGGADIVGTVFEPSEDGLGEIAVIEEADPKLLIVGPIISAQAYTGKVYGMTSAPGFERVAVDQKRMNPSKFTVYLPKENV